MIRDFFKRKPKSVTEVTTSVAHGFFSTDLDIRGKSRSEILAEVDKRTFQKLPPVAVNPPGTAMDAVAFTKAQFSVGDSNAPDILIAWYGAQGFLGWQTLAIISQHWLVDKACTMPAKDAVRNGYEVTRNDGKKLTPEIQDKIRAFDKKFRVKQNLVQFSRMSRIFGIRIAMFEFSFNSPEALREFYKNPFNIDGVKKGSYKGISQIDPYWITPLLNADASGNPASQYFYEPTWWVVNGVEIHRTHLIITRTNEVPDILKPTYVYGGISLVQRIFERIYAAERTANEAPMLAMTKRTGVLQIDTAQAIGNQTSIEQKLAKWAFLRDNYGVHAIGSDETYSQIDTALTDLDAVIMTQYQIVAAIAEVPAVKLMGTSPKGFNASGNYEAESYHEFLKTIQSDEMEPLLERHHMLLMKSEIAPEAPFELSIKWNALNTPSGEEKALVEKTKAETDGLLVATGAIDGRDVRDRIISDPESPYSGIGDEIPDTEEGQPLQGSEHFSSGSSPDAEENNGLK